MNAQWLLGWWNLIFIIPFLLALGYLALYTVSGVTFGEADADGDLHADFGADADGDFHADVDHDLDHNLDHDVDPGADGDLHDGAHANGGSAGEAHGEAHGEMPSEGEAESAIAAAAIGWLGVGRVPLSILLMVLLLTWGAIGFVTNELMRPLVSRDWRSVLAALPAALFGSLLLTRVVVLTMGRWLPLNETTARRRHALLGSVAEALFPIDAGFGMACGRDEHGELFQVSCRLAGAQREQGPIAKGERVRLASYNARQNVFHVVRHDGRAGAAGDARSADVANVTNQKVQEAAAGAPTRAVQK